MVEVAMVSLDRVCSCRPVGAAQKERKESLAESISAELPKIGVTAVACHYRSRLFLFLSCSFVLSSFTDGEDHCCKHSVSWL